MTDPVKKCDNCPAPAEYVVKGGHEGQRTFYYCSRCLPPDTEGVTRHDRRI